MIGRNKEEHKGAEGSRRLRRTSQIQVTMCTTIASLICKTRRRFTYKMHAI